MDRPPVTRRRKITLIVVLLLLVSLIISVALGVAWFTGLQQVHVY